MKTSILKIVDSILLVTIVLSISFLAMVREETIGVKELFFIVLIFGGSIGIALKLKTFERLNQLFKK